MLFEFNQFSALLLIFFVHGFVYAILLWSKSLRNEISSDKWLSIFLLLCILYICPWMVGFAGWYDNQPYRDILFYVPFQQLYFIGPVIFFYVQSLLNPSFTFGRKQWVHLLPGILYLFFSVVVVMTDKVWLQRYYFLASGEDPDFDQWYQVSGLVSMGCYFFLSLRYYQSYRRLIVQVMSNADRLMFKWVKNFLIAFLLMLLVRSGFYIVSFLVNTSYWDTWWYFLSFALIFYYIAITGYANSVKTKVSFKPDLFGNSPPLLLTYPESIGKIKVEEAEVIEISTVATKEDEEVVRQWKEKIINMLTRQKLYEDAELSLTELAKQLKTNASVLSKMINKGFGLNFNDLINQFRVEAVKDKIQKGEHARQTLLAIAFECGFNSKATFNRAFKKTTGMTPRDYIRNNDPTGDY